MWQHSSKLTVIRHKYQQHVNVRLGLVHLMCLVMCLVLLAIQGCEELRDVDYSARAATLQVECVQRQSSLHVVSMIASPSDDA
jgi:hypothetical protein